MWEQSDEETDMVSNFDVSCSIYRMQDLYDPK